MRREKGAITIEATISLSAFMFLIVTLLTLVNICIVQARIAYAIHTTAKEISQYSYLYSLTGINGSQSRLYNAAKEQTGGIDKIVSNVNEVYSQIESLGNTAADTSHLAGYGSLDVGQLTESWNSAVGNIQNIEAAGSSIAGTMSEIAKDPKSLMFGIAKMAGSDGFDLAKSRLIAAPVAKLMCQRHLVNEKNGDVEAFLRYVGVVPSGAGSYLGGLDFSRSSIFPHGSNEITINVSYDVKAIALLPLDFKFHFNQTAVTHGWLAGEASFKSGEKVEETYVETDSLWVKAGVKERTDFIRHQAFEDLKKEGYGTLVKPNTSGVLFSETKNEFVMPRSMNPLWSAEDEEPKTPDDIDEAVMKHQIEMLCGDLRSNEYGDEVTVKTENRATGEKGNKTVSSKNATYKIILTIPEDEGLKEKMEEIISGCNTRGVTIELNQSYGKGVNKEKAQTPEGGQNAENGGENE